MIEQNARAWTAELRSGRYKQGQGKLTHTSEDQKDADCCLGVACKLYLRDIDPSYPVKSLGVVQIRYLRVVQYGGDDDLGSTMNLPHLVALWLGAKNSAGLIDHPFMSGLQHKKTGLHVLQRTDRWDWVAENTGLHTGDLYQHMKLTGLNDDGLSFDQIADTIDFFWDCI